MSKYNIIQAIFMSFYSKKLYKDVALNWGGKSFLYLFFLLALSWIALTYQIHVMLGAYYIQFAERFVHQFPVLTIVKGEINTPESRPYIITDPDSKETIAVIDTTGKYTQIDQIQTYVLITKNEIITKPKSHETRIDKLSDTTTLTVEPTKINHYVKDYIISFLWIFIFFVCWFSSFLYRIIQALLYSIIGKIISTSLKIEISYSQIMLIAMVSITPVIIISSILMSLEIYFRYQYWMYFFLGILYLFYGILANKDEKISSEVK